jgi:flagellar hook assembly protein FlgD
VRFTGTLSSALDWTVTVRDDTGAVVGTGKGTGKAVDWTWDARSHPFGTYTYSIDAADARPAEGRVPGPPPLEVTSLKVRPKVVSPNGDDVRDAAKVTYALSTRATVRVEVLDSSAQVVRSLAAAQAYRSGSPSFVWDGRNASGKLVRDGDYRVRVTATSPGQQAVKTRRVVVDRTLGHLTVTPTPFSANGDGRLDATTIAFRLAREAGVRVRIVKGETVVATLRRLGTLSSGPAEFTWAGTKNNGPIAADGTYEALVEATTSLGTRTLSLPVTLDTRAPVVRIVSARIKNGRTHVRLWLSEVAMVRAVYAQPDWQNSGSRAVSRPAGYSGLTLARATKVRVRATDAAANVGARAAARVAH